MANSSGLSRRAALRQQQELEDRRKRTNRVIGIGLGIVALAVVAILAVVVLQTLAKSGNSTAGPSTGQTADQQTPPNATESFGINITSKGTPAAADAPHLVIYEDFQCPACEQLEKAVGPTIKQMSEAGEVKVAYHIKNFLDANLGNDSSTRAGNAAACAADVGAFQAYHDQVYAHPPAKEGDGYTDAQLEQFATGAGISGANLVTWKKCVADKKYDSYIKGVDEATAKAGVNSTPTLQVNGKTFDLSAQKVTSAQDFRTKVLAAGK